jgi:(2R)-3-sulfolactate dehydrogenase (NADP+)
MSTTTIRAAELETLIAAALTASATSPTNARSVARALTQAEIDGQKGHGLARVESYALQARCGKVDGHAVPIVAEGSRGTLMVDVRHGFFYPAFDAAIEPLARLARECGVAAAGFTRSHHYGVAGQHAERLAEGGLVALIMGNTPEAMAPWGGRRAMLGTNPLAFAAPQRGRPALVIDMALSEVARSKVRAAAEKGTSIPPNWAVDKRGKPTTDAKAALEGTLLPIGGAKGSALALMVEVLAVALTGAKFAFEASSFFDDKGGPPGVGQLALAIDPAAFGGGDRFLDRVGDLVARIEAEPGARLPGARRLAEREQAMRDGVHVDSHQLAGARLLAGAGSD